MAEAPDAARGADARRPQEAGGRAFDALLELVAASRRLVALTGAGCSTESGIPDYRDERGDWKRARPVMYREFLADARIRRRYWARSTLGWRHVRRAQPSGAHRGLAALEAAGKLHWLITQNVDGLHEQAGSRRVIALHGRLDRVGCLDCGAEEARADFQRRLEGLNEGWIDQEAAAAPDGDASLESSAWETFEVPACKRCAGLMKPGVVFFGESVPRERVAAAMQRVGEADALLVAGSSLMVFSGLRFVREAARAGLPMAAVNLGRTRGDDLFSVKLAASCGATLERLAAAFVPGGATLPRAPARCGAPR